jgi:hypothetical protein
MVHQSDTKDLISYNLSINTNRLELIEVCKVVNIAKHPTTIPLLPNDVTYFESKIIPNHDRDFPDVRDLECPSYLLTETQRNSRSVVILGQLVGAFEVPIIPEVLIDVWKVDNSVDGSLQSNSVDRKKSGHESKIWATTVIDNVNFAVLERIFISYEISYGSKNIVQIDLFGRNPKTGKLLVESIVPT